MTGLIRQDSNILPSLEHLHICLYHGDMRAISSDRAQFILAISNDALRTTFRAIESRQVNPRYGKACIVYSKSRQLYKWLPVAMMLTKIKFTLQGCMSGLGRKFLLHFSVVLHIIIM
jgi:hypothetical protein